MLQLGHLCWVIAGDVREGTKSWNIPATALWSGGKERGLEMLKLFQWSQLLPSSAYTQASIEDLSSGRDPRRSLPSSTPCAHSTVSCSLQSNQYCNSERSQRAR